MYTWENRLVRFVLILGYLSSKFFGKDMGFWQVITCLHQTSSFPPQVLNNLTSSPRPPNFVEVGGWGQRWVDFPLCKKLQRLNPKKDGV